MNNPVTTGPDRLAGFVALEQRLRACSDMARLGYLVVNDSRLLFSYRSAFLWTESGSRARIAAISGLPEPGKNTPFDQWATRLCRTIDRSDTAIKPLCARDVDAELAAQWQDYLPPALIWVPLASRDGRLLGALALCRESGWRDEEIRMLALWADAIAHALEALTASAQRSFVARTRRLLGGRWRASLALLLLLGALWFPVSLSVLVPAEVVARNTQVIRSPLDGVIDEVYVQPNAHVAAGAPLIRLDTTELLTRLEEAAQELGAAQATLRRARQLAVSSPKDAARLAELQSLMQQKRATHAYYRDVIERTTIYSEQDGIAIVGEAEQLVGLPVQLGQRLLSVARQEDAAVELWIPVADNIPLPAGATIEVFLNISPDAPVSAVLDYVNYQAEEDLRGTLAFRAMAHFDAGETLPRIGLHATAKVYGESVRLGYLLFRRPVATLRRWIGV